MKTIIKEVRNVNAITEEPKLDLSLFRRRGNSKTFSGYLIQKMKEARDNGNQELVQLINHFYRKYMEFQTSEKVRLDSWKGKSSFIIKDTKDIIYVEKWQKPEKGAEPKQLNFEIERTELIRLLESIRYLFRQNPEKEFLKSRVLGEYFYGESWFDIFNNRSRHNLYTIMLDVLDKKELINYKGGKITLKENQEELYFK